VSHSLDNVVVTMIRILFVLSLFVLASCGPSTEEKINIAAVTCSIMGETRNMDAAVRVREMNNAREKIGGEPFLRGDDTIKESFEWGLCQELVLNQNYDETLQSLKDAKRERERIAAEEQRIAAEKRAEEQRIAAEKRAEKQRIADSKPTVKEEFYSNGELQSRGNYQPKSDGGKKHGLHEFFYKSGQLMTKENFKDGKLDGLSETYHENGQLISTSKFKDGEYDGLFFNKNFENGQLIYEICYKNGEETDMSYCEE
jgi:hypothetical protein